jgi:hypothetical protein
VIVRVALSLGALVTSMACASMSGFRVAFNGDQTGYRPEDTPSIYVLPNSQNLEHTLDVEARRMVEGALRQMGYAITTEAKADVYLLVEAWIDDKEVKQIASVIQPQSVSVIREPNGTTRTVRMPERPLSFPVSVKMKYPRMAMIAVDGKQFRSSSEAKILWRGDTILPRAELLLHEAVPYLLYPLIASFGTQSKGVVMIDVSSQQAMGFK